MIKINLAKAPKVVAQEQFTSDLSAGPSPTELQKQGALRLFVIMLFPLGLYLWESQIIPAKQQELTSKTAVLSELTAKNEKAKKAVEEIKKFKTDQQRLQSQIGALEDLKRGRLQEVKALDFIQRVIPPRVWLNRIELAAIPDSAKGPGGRSDSRMTMQGLASNDQGVAAFIDQLAKSIFLREVSLIRTTDQIDEGTGFATKRFEISTVMEKVQ